MLTHHCSCSLPFRFHLSTKDVCHIFLDTLKLMAAALSPMIVFYTRNEVAKTLPREFKNFKRIRCIIDCSELFIQRPSDLKLQAATWSDYKSHNTLKFLVAITPQGSIAYVSDLYGGRTSDRHIVRDCGFLKGINPHDEVMADRGFGLREEFMLKGARLIIPPASKGRAQMSSGNVQNTKKVANVRIHVERVIRRMKCFRFLSNTISVSMLRHCDDVVKVVAAITNLQGPIVKSWTRMSSK